VRATIQARIWRRSFPLAWKQTRLFQPGRIGACVAISALNVLWHGHGILRSSPTAVRLVLVAVACYIAVAVGEFLWLLYSGPSFTGFESPTTPQAGNGIASADPLVEQLSELPPAALRDETLQLTNEMKSFEAVTDREYVEALAGTRLPRTGSDAELDEVLDRQSAELMEHNLRTWRAYRERFYRPARAFRDELRRRLGIRNSASEPRIPALDQATLSGAKPIAQAADYLAGLARRLK